MAPLVALTALTLTQRPLHYVPDAFVVRQLGASSKPLFDDLGTALWFVFGLFAVLIVVSVGVALAVVFSNRRFRAVGAMLRVPSSEIALAIDGEVVRIVGEVVAGDPLLSAPLSGRECAFYQVVVSSHSSVGEVNSSTTASLNDAVDECVGTRFYVRGGSGTAEIDPSGARAFFESEETYGASDDEPLEPALRALLDRYGLPGNRYTATESILLPGTQVSVMGVAEWSADRSQLRLSSTQEQPLNLSDLPTLLAEA